MNKLSKVKKWFAAGAAVLMPFAASVTAFASSGSSVDYSAPVVTADQLKPLYEGVSANIGVILPVGLGIFAIFLGISIIPKLVNKFKNG